MKSQVTLHDSAWFKVNTDGTETPIAKEDWEKVHDLVLKNQRLKITDGKAQYWKPTPLKLYEIDAEFEVTNYYDEGFMGDKKDWIRLAYLVEPKNKL